MLMVVMHNKQDYLEFLLSLVKEEGITDAAIIEKEGLSFYLIGVEGISTFHRSKFPGEYDRALVVVIKREEKVGRLLSMIENNNALKMLGLEGKGCVCTMPFEQIRFLEPELSYVKEKGFKMRISDYLKEKRILLNLKARYKEESIKEIAALLKDSKDIVNFRTFLSDVFEREKAGTTGIGNGLAIPHARTDAVKDFVIAFGRSQEGVEFKSLDGNLAKLIFLMGTPKEKGLSAYLKLLAQLTKILKNADFRESLLKASSPKEILNEFKKIES